MADTITAPSIPANDMEFVNQLAEKLEKAEQSDTTSTDDDSSGASDAEDHGSDGSGAADDEPDHDETDSGADDSSADDSDDADDRTDGSTSDDQTDDSDDANETGRGETNDATETDAADDGSDDTPTADDKALASEVKSLLDKSGLKISLKDLPAEARVLVERKLTHANAAITRALQEANSFRKERAAFVAERQLFREQPELIIAELVATHGDALVEKINEITGKLDDPDKRRLFASDLAEARKKAVDAVTAAERQVDTQYQRSDEIESYVRKAADTVGVPTDILEQAVALALLGKPENKRDLTDEELDTVIAKQARIFRGATRASNTQAAKEQIRQRTKDRRTSTPAVRAGSGVTNPTPARKKAPSNDAEFTALMESKLK